MNERYICFRPLTSGSDVMCNEDTFMFVFKTRVTNFNTHYRTQMFGGGGRSNFVHCHAVFGKNLVKQECIPVGCVPPAH